MAAVVPGSMFRKLDADSKQPLKALLAEHGLKFVKGSAYYQLTKAETIQDYKKVVVMRKAGGAFIAGEAVRDVLGIEKDAGTKFRLDLDAVPDFAVFVQSTSHNRVVHPGEMVLYDLSDTDGHCPDTSTPGDSGAPAPRRSTRARACKTEVAVAPAPPTTPSGRKRKATAAPSKDDGAAATETPAKRTTRRSGGREATATRECETAEAAPAAPATPTPAATASPSGARTGPVDIAFSFDTTGSMYPCLGEVRRKLRDTIVRLKRDVPGIRMAVIAHGDYCDAASSYVTKRCDFTSDVATLSKFVQTVGMTGGGDFEECYELVLREARESLAWRPHARKSLVVIGDATPHEPDYPLNDANIDWRAELDSLLGASIRVYAVQALNVSQSTTFYRRMASATQGFHLQLDQFSSIPDFILAICYREQGDAGLQAFECEVRESRMNRELHRLFDSLAGRKTEFAGCAAAGDLEPVSPSRFQVLQVDRKISIKEFVQGNSIVFKTGRGFYEFTKPEKISAKKEVVLVDKATGDMFTGPQACDMIGAGGESKIKPTALKDFRVFVQSTSYNRVLVSNTGFLYEVDNEH